MPPHRTTRLICSNPLSTLSTCRHSSRVFSGTVWVPLPRPARPLMRSSAAPHHVQWRGDARPALPQIPHAHKRALPALRTTMRHHVPMSRNPRQPCHHALPPRMPPPQRSAPAKQPATDLPPSRVHAYTPHERESLRLLPGGTACGTACLRRGRLHPQSGRVHACIHPSEGPLRAGDIPLLWQGGTHPSFHTPVLHHTPVLRRAGSRCGRRGVCGAGCTCPARARRSAACAGSAVPST